MADNMVFILVERSIDAEVLDLFAKLGIKNFTKWPDVMGIGENGPHLGSPIWPNLNNAIMTVIEESLRERLLAGIADLQKEYPFTGLRAFAIPVLART